MKKLLISCNKKDFKFIFIVEEKNEELKKRPRLKKPNKSCVIHALFKYRPNISVHYGVKFYNF